MFMTNAAAVMFDEQPSTFRLSIPQPSMTSASRASWASAIASGTAETLNPMNPPQVLSPMSPSGWEGKVRCGV